MRRPVLRGIRGGAIRCELSRIGGAVGRRSRTGERVVGMISIGDVVKETLKQQRWLIGQLQAYIGGTYTAAGSIRS